MKGAPTRCCPERCASAGLLAFLAARLADCCDERIGRAAGRGAWQHHQLENVLGLPDGQPVEVTVQVIHSAKRHAPGEGILRSAGAWGDDAAELDEYLEWNRQQRKASRAEIEE